MNCPNCASQLKGSHIAELHVETCPDCQGAWLEYDELRQAKDAIQPDAAWMDFEIWKHEDQFKFGANERLCPACEVPMASIAYGESEVVVDYCTSCRGTWLDDGELGKIIYTLYDQAARMSLPEYLKATLQEARELVDGPESLAGEWKDLGSVLRMLQVRLLAEQPRLMQAVLAMQMMRRSM